MSWFIDLFRKKPEQSVWSKLKAAQDLEDAAPRAELEYWRPIPGTWGNYEVSSYGRLRSCFDGAFRLCKPNDAGRAMQATCWVRSKGKYRHFTMSRTVCELFIRPLKKGEVVRYRDGNYRNVAATNLYISDRATMNAESALHGDNHPCSKLTNAQVAVIRAKLDCGEQGRKLAAEYGVHEATISCIKNGKRWKEAA